MPHAMNIVSQKRESSLGFEAEKSHLHKIERLYSASAWAEQDDTTS